MENTEQQHQEPVVAAESTSFLDNISEELRSEASLKDFKDVNSLAKSYINAQKMIGNSIRIPSEDASPEAKQEFYGKLKDLDGVIVKPVSDEDKDSYYNKLGRPESKEAYKLQELLSDEIKSQVPNVNLEIENFQEEAFNLGLTNDQAKNLIEKRILEAKESMQTQELAKQESLQKLQSMWGQDFDNRLNAAKEMVKVYSEKYPEEMNQLVNSSAGNNPALLNMLVELGSSFKEKGHVGMQKANFGITPEGAMDKIKEKRSDVGFMKAYSDDKHPGHKRAVEELMKLYEIAQG